jgi:hypothetical protein
MKEANFAKVDKAQRFKCDVPVRAFDAEGGEHLFTPESHVSLLCILVVIPT